MSAELPPVRVFVSYAHDDQKHVDQVRAFADFLRSCGIDAQLDLAAGERRQDWALWMLRGMRASRHVIVVASPEYKRRAEGDAPAGVGAGVQWEALLLREVVYKDHAASLDWIVPVVLPGGSVDDLPLWLEPHTTSHYPVEDFTVPGAEELLRLLTCQPRELVHPLGPRVVLPPRGQAGPVPGTAPLVLPPRVVAASPVEPPQPPPATFVFPDKKVLLDALMACEALHRLAARHELVALMGETLGLGHPFDVAEDSQARTHLRALVRRTASTLTRDAALTAMYFALADIAPDDIGTERVRVLLVASGLTLKEA
ncbi:SEFIR domain-containing protein [Streptomyces sp. NBC_00986]|uniref:SEFIR domain-containing protein n=1 Tax=Streptomyces sp. NBC_00986 TaxID=2903702 RepID=UPI0038688775|nr:TIR domain-containing protein [Streptomyces sp. NBC_00986]